MKHFLICLILVLGLASPRSWAADGEAASADAPKVLYAKKGDTLEGLAKKYLGSTEFASELAAYNQLKPDQPLDEGAPLVLPGAERVQAMSLLNNADLAMKEAAGREAGTYALESFKKAVTLMESAVESRKNATYPRASLLARLAIEEFNKASQLADQQALAPQPGSLKNLKGEVSISEDGGETWKKANAGKTSVKPGNWVRTGADSSVDLVLPVGTMEVGGASILSLAASREDRRSQVREVVAVLQQGVVSGDFPPANKEGSVFILSNGGVEIKPAGARLTTRRTSEGRFDLAVYEGVVPLGRGGKQYKLTAGTGAYAAPGTELKGPIELPVAPAWVYPPELEFTTASQQVELAWQGSPESRYEVQVSGDASFENPSIQKMVSGSRFQTPVLGAGDYYVRVRSFGNSGLEGFTSETVLLTVKTNLGVAWGELGPSVERGGRKIVGKNAALVARAGSKDSSVVAVEYSVNGGPFSMNDQGITITEGGEYVVAARGKAADGKTGEEIQQVLIVDSAAPELRLHIGEVLAFPGKEPYRSVSVLVSDDTQMGPVEFSVDNAEFAPYVAPLKLSVQANHRFAVRAVDAFGNRAETSVIIERTGAPDAPSQDNRDKKKSGSGWSLF